MKLPIVYRRCAAGFVALAKTVSDEDQRRALIETAEKWRDLASAIEGYMKENGGEEPSLQSAKPAASPARRAGPRGRRLH